MIQGQQVRTIFFPFLFVFILIKFSGSSFSAHIGLYCATC